MQKLEGSCGWVGLGPGAGFDACAGLGVEVEELGGGGDVNIGAGKAGLADDGFGQVALPAGLAGGDIDAGEIDAAAGEEGVVVDPNDLAGDEEGGVPEEIAGFAIEGERAVAVAGGKDDGLAGNERRSAEAGDEVVDGLTKA